MKPDDQAILVTHQPMWLAEWFSEKAGCHNLRQLVRCHLRGRARIHLAGASLQLQRPVSLNAPSLLTSQSAASLPIGPEPPTDALKPARS